MKLNKKLLPLLEKYKPLKVAYGGRDSGKSIGFGDIFLMKMDTEGADIYCLREFQDTVFDSVHRVFRQRIEDLGLGEDGFPWTVNETSVTSPLRKKNVRRGSTVYKGASRNPDNVQSAQNFKYSWFEEAQKISQDTLDRLLPTIIRNPGAECWFSGNPHRSSDPFSQRFIMPFVHKLNRDGYYEDDLHLIVKLNWRDNPWYDYDATEKLRQWDYTNFSRARYNWIWEGDFYDGIEDCLIQPEWFDACIDAHKKLGFEPLGIRMASFDPSDSGDPKAFAFRHGSVVLDVQQTTKGDVNEACDWACNLAMEHNADGFTWDCDGLGISLTRQVSKAFEGHHTIVAQYKGSEKVDLPDAIYEPVGENVQGQLKNKEAFKNKRAQYYVELRDKIHRTFEAVVQKKYHDPDQMISFDSGITDLTELRSEICTMPVKPNKAGLIELYTKEAMKSIFKLPSPNLADAVKMLGRIPKSPLRLAASRRPPVIMPMGKSFTNRRSIGGRY